MNLSSRQIAAITVDWIENTRGGQVFLEVSSEPIDGTSVVVSAMDDESAWSQYASKVRFTDVAINVISPAKAENIQEHNSTTASLEGLLINPIALQGLLGAISVETKSASFLVGADQIRDTIIVRVVTTSEVYQPNNRIVSTSIAGSLRQLCENTILNYSGGGEYGINYTRSDSLSDLILQESRIVAVFRSAQFEYIASGEGFYRVAFPDLSAAVSVITDTGDLQFHNLVCNDVYNSLNVPVIVGQGLTLYAPVAGGETATIRPNSIVTEFIVTARGALT